MSSGRHTVIIELDASGGTPQGGISVDGGRLRAFYGWIELTAYLESLTGSSEAWAEGRVT
jgi:hypothetical protein